MNESSPTSVFYQIIQALGFQDITSFVLALVFIITALAFVISGVIFLIKKRIERQKTLLQVVHDVQKPLIQEKPEAEKLEAKPSVDLKPETKPEPKPEPIPKPEPKPKPKPKPTPKPEPRPTPVIPKPEPEPMPTPIIPPSEPEPRGTPERQPEPEPEPEPESKPMPEADGKKALGAALKNTRGGFIEKIAVSSHVAMKFVTLILKKWKVFYLPQILGLRLHKSFWII